MLFPSKLKRPKDEINTLFEYMKDFFNEYGQSCQIKCQIKVIGTKTVYEMKLSKSLIG